MVDSSEQPEQPDITQFKLDSIDKLSRDPSLSAKDIWDRTYAIVHAPGWTVYHVVARQAGLIK